MPYLVKSNLRGVKQVHEHKTGARKDLKPGVNKLNDHEYEMYKSQILDDDGLEVLEALNDVPAVKPVEDKKASKKSKAEEKLEEKGEAPKAE